MWAWLRARRRRWRRRAWRGGRRGCNTKDAALSCSSPPCDLRPCTVPASPVSLPSAQIRFPLSWSLLPHLNAYYLLNHPITVPAVLSCPASAVYLLSLHVLILPVFPLMYFHRPVATSVFSLALHETTALARQYPLPCLMSFPLSFIVLTLTGYYSCSFASCSALHPYTRTPKPCMSRAHMLFTTSSGLYCPLPL